MNLNDFHIRIRAWSVDCRLLWLESHRLVRQMNDMILEWNNAYPSDPIPLIPTSLGEAENGLESTNVSER